MGFRAARLPILRLWLAGLGCASTSCLGGVPQGDPRALERIEALEQRKLDAGTPLPAVDPLELSSEMRQFAAQFSRKSHAPAERLRALHDALFDPAVRGIVHAEGRSRTASEVFAAGSGDCLSLANLFIALAREIGLDARYQEVYLQPSWTERADLWVLQRHVNVAGRLGDGVEYSVDFLDLTGSEVAPARIVSDRRALAQHYNNQAVESLTQGELGPALARFKRALRIEPGLEFAWSNLGAAYRRAGEYEAAEAAYLESFALDPQNESTAGNLAALYQRVGRTEDAARFAALAERHRLRNPFYREHRAEQALAAGDAALAVREYRRAVALAPDQLRFRAGLAEAERLRDAAEHGRAEPLPDASAP